MLTFLGEGCEYCKQVADILAEEGSKKALDGERAKEVQDWLMVRGPYFRDVLEQRARALRFNDGSLEGKDELTALARLDWPAAAPLLQRLEAEADQRVQAVALALRYRHSLGSLPSEEAQYRKRLMAIASDSKSPGTARDLAFEALMETEWPGQEAWFISKFSDATLLRLSDGYMGFSPLAYPVGKNPERWIPIVTRLIGREDRSAHNNAASVLAQFNLGEAREDALRPLIPWLSDPNWAGSQKWSPSDRLRLIQTMDRVNLPECVPGLIWVLKHSNETFEIEGAAEGIAHHRDLRGVPAMKSALERLGTKISPAQHSNILAAILQCGGYSDTELVRMVEVYAAWKAKQRDKYEKQAPSGIDAGRLLLWKKENRDRLAPLLVARITSLTNIYPTRAAAIWALIHEWDQPSVDQERIARLRSGNIDADTLVALMADRVRIQKNSQTVLAELANMGGWRQGLVASLCGDREQQRVVMDGKDREAKIGLLASAKCGLVPLSIPEVVDLARSTDAGLSNAASRYLEALDTKEARAAYWALYQGQIRIIGMPAKTAFFDKSIRSWEEILRREMILNPELLEIVGMHESSNWGNGPKFVLRRTS
ncbi:MAG: hypothetical protein Q8O00_10905, partial [Holophaga sp.]|nr:hypothetical protein [Holophaga sp.]